MKSLTLTWVFVPLLLLLQYEIWLAPGGVVSIWRLHNQLAQETQTQQTWTERNRHLSADIHSLKSGTDVIEGHARHDLGMIKPGEVLYRVP